MNRRPVFRQTFSVTFHRGEKELKKSIWATACAALATAGLIALAPTSANAATVTTEPAVTGVVHDIYRNELQCRFAGITGMASGQWKTFECYALPMPGTPFIVWYLEVD